MVGKIFKRKGTKTNGHSCVMVILRAFRQSSGTSEACHSVEFQRNAVPVLSHLSPLVIALNGLTIKGSPSDPRDCLF